MNKLGLQWSEHDSGLLSTSLIASLISGPSMIVVCSPPP